MIFHNDITNTVSMEVPSKPCQTSKMELLAKIVNNFESSTVSAKRSVLDVSRVLITLLYKHRRKSFKVKV